MTLRRLFDSLVDLPPDEQREKIDAAGLTPAQRRQLLGMLSRSGDVAAMLDEPLEAWFERLGRGLPAGELPPGTRVGPFEILDRLGSGGTAVVYRARRPAGDGIQLVALKMLRTAALSADEERRLRREQAILAQLSHPNIARLVEGGLDGGHPFIAMELVDGHPLNEYCDAHALGLRARLQLFATLCRAIQHAHASLVVHCDLKPSNVLVDTHGVLKVLDFGIARLVDAAHGEQTTRTVALTPEYAAPEQFRPGPPSTLVDIYALGVMLGELATGLRLVGGMAAAAAVRDTALPVPAGLPARDKLARQLRGDLECILRRATAENPAERYASAQALAEDIERFLAHRPVRARPGSAAYRAWRFLTRHRAAAAATAVALALLVALSIYALEQARVATAASAAATAQAARADAMRDIAFGVFEDAESRMPGSADTTVGEAVERAVERLQADAGVDRRVRLEVLGRLAEVLGRRGDAPRVLALLREAVDEADASLPAQDELRLSLHGRLAMQEIQHGDYAAARARIAMLLDVTRDGAPELRLDALRRAAVLESRERHAEAALAHAEEALALARALDDENLVVHVLSDTAAIHSNLEQWPQAQRTYGALLPRVRALYGERHENVAKAWSGLARAERALGNFAEAEAAVRAALTIDEALYEGRPHYNTANHLNALVRLLLQQRRLREALVAAQRGLDIYRATVAPDDRRLPYALQDVGWTQALLERYDEAEPLLQEALKIRRALPNAEADAAITQANLGFVHAQQGRVDEGAAELDAAIATLDGRREYAEQLAIALEKRFHVARLARQPEYALALAHRLEEPLATLPPATRARFEGRPAALRGLALLDLGREDDALTALQTARERFAVQAVTWDPVLRADVLMALEKVHSRRNDPTASKSARDERDLILHGFEDLPRRLRP